MGRTPPPPSVDREPRVFFLSFSNRHRLDFAPRFGTCFPCDSRGFVFDSNIELTVYAAGSAAAPSSSPAAEELEGTAAAVCCDDGDDVVAATAAALADDDELFSCFCCWGLRDRLRGVAAAATWRGRPRGELRDSPLQRVRACEAMALFRIFFQAFFL